LLQSTTSARSDTLLLLLALSLQQRRAEKRNLLALIESAQDLGVVEIADAYAHYARCVRRALLHKYYLYAESSAPGGTASAATAATARPGAGCGLAA
jgi:hypothetical protein